jgi:hypothetical protein
MANDQFYVGFNNFQTAFYTDTKKFNEYSLYEFKQFGFTLLYNLSKGFPNLSDLILNLNGIGWNSQESPGILKALQRKFVNNFNASRVPQFIYYKAEKVDKPEKIKKTSQGYVFDIEIQNQIKTILMIDSKTYEYLQFGEKIQFLGQQLVGDFKQKATITPIKKTKKK